MTVLLAFAVILLLIITILLGRLMSKTADLTAAVDKVLAFIDTLKNAPVTPDSEVQQQIDRLNSAVPPPQQ